MGERAKILINEYTAKELLKRDDLNLDKFYSADLKTMIKSAQEELKKKDNIINELEKDLKNKIEGDRLNILSNPHWLYVLDKIKELKEEGKKDER